MTRAAAHNLLVPRCSMPERITKTQRWLDLIALLLNRQIPLAVEEIMERIPAYAEQWRGDEKARASVRRMFERDKDELRALGVPIESVRYDINYGAQVLEGYRILRRDFYLPYLRVLGRDQGERERGLAAVELSPEEAGTVIEALGRVAEIPAFPFRDEAESALAKLTFDLDADSFPTTPTIHLERPGTAEVLERLSALTDALLSGKRVSFRYRGIRRDESTNRSVDPYGLFLQRDWYLVGHDHDRGETRTFRVSRMDDVEMNTRSLKQRDFEVPEDFDIRAYVGRRAWELADEEPVQADVLFRFPAALVVARSAEGRLVQEYPDGSALRRFEVSDTAPFLRWVLGFAGEASVMGPPALKDAFRRVAAETAALYGTSDG